jgi:hypothetical protein
MVMVLNLKDHKLINKSMKLYINCKKIILELLVFTIFINKNLKKRYNNKNTVKYSISKMIPI